MNKERFKKILKEANELKKIQGADGNYNYDSYMLGVYNGMELVIAMFEARKPKFINGHDIKFLSEQETDKRKYLIEVRNVKEGVTDANNQM